MRICSKCDWHHFNNVTYQGVRKVADTIPAYSTHQNKQKVRTLITFELFFILDNPVCTLLSFHIEFAVKVCNETNNNIEGVSAAFGWRTC